MGESPAMVRARHPKARYYADGRGGVLDFLTFPHFRRLILDPATGEVVRR
jgi:hypothetical protein